MTTNFSERARHHVSVTWYGQSGFRLEAGDSRVLIDPFLTDRADRRYKPPASASDFADITLVLCTHEHVDHLDLPFLRDLCAVNARARIIVPAPVVEIAVDGRLEWRPIGAADGVFDTADEAIDADLSSLVPPGSHIVTVRAFDLAGNVVVEELESK